MKRTFGIALTAALAVLLSGCMRMHVNLTLEEGDKASGNLIFAISDTVAEQTGMAPEELLASMLDGDSDMAPEGATAEEYAQDGFTGTKWSFESKDFSEATTGQEMTITRDGDDYVFDGEMDMTGDDFAGDELTAGMADSMDIAVSVTFPGKIVEANGEIDGNTVTWHPEPGKVTEMDARGSAKAAGGLSLPLIIGIVLGLLVLGAIAAALMAAKKRKGAKDEPNYDYPTYNQQATFPSETAPGVPTGAGLDGPGINANAAGAAAGAIAVGAGAGASHVDSQHESAQGSIPVYDAPPTRASMRAAASAPESFTPASEGSAPASEGSAPVSEDTAPTHEGSAPAPEGSTSAAGSNAATPDVAVAQDAADTPYEIPGIDESDVEPHDHWSQAAPAETTPEGLPIPSIEESEAPQTHAIPVVQQEPATHAPTRDLFEPLELTEPFVPENDSPADSPAQTDADIPETNSGLEDYTQELPEAVSNDSAAEEPTQVFPQPPVDPENPENPQQ